MSKVSIIIVFLIIVALVTDKWGLTFLLPSVAILLMAEIMMGRGSSGPKKSNRGKKNQEEIQRNLNLVSFFLFCDIECIMSENEESRGMALGASVSQSTVMPDTSGDVVNQKHDRLMERR